MQEKLQKIYKLYKATQYTQAEALNNEVLAIEPQNPYAQRYKGLIADKISDTTRGVSSSKKSSGDVPRVKGKLLKCPKCISKISFSSMTEEQQKSIKNNDYSNLELKCPYCHTSFSLQKKKSSSVLGLKIGDIASIDSKKFRVTGYVQYVGKYKEYSRGIYQEGGNVTYLEWILLSEKGEYRYLSESRAIWNGGSELTFELSQKYIPSGKIDLNTDQMYIHIGEKKTYFQESSTLSVKSMYGENSKAYTLGEKIELFESRGLVVEKEGTINQREIGFYKEKEISQKEACALFGKKVQRSSGKRKPHWTNAIFPMAVVGFAYTAFPMFGIIMGFIVGLIILWHFLADRYKKIIIYSGISGVLTFAIAFGIGRMLSTVSPISGLEEMTVGGNYELKFSQVEVGKEVVTQRRTYDYGGIKTHYSQDIGWKFSIHDESDMKILTQIKEYSSQNVNILGSISDEVKNILRKVKKSTIYIKEDFFNF